MASRRPYVILMLSVAFGACAALVQMNRLNLYPADWDRYHTCEIKMCAYDFPWLSVI